MCSKETRIVQMLVVAVKDIWAVALHLSDMLTGHNIIGHMDRKAKLQLDRRDFDSRVIISWLVPKYSVFAFALLISMKNLLGNYYNCNMFCHLCSWFHVWLIGFFRLLLGIVFFSLWKSRGKISTCLGQFDGVGEVEASVKRDEEAQTASGETLSRKWVMPL